MVTAVDRNGRKLHLGDVVHLTPGMQVGRRKKGFITCINGEDIYIEMCGPGKISGVHRYGCEMERVQWSPMHETLDEWRKCV
jgi:hypothetical protein